MWCRVKFIKILLIMGKFHNVHVKWIQISIKYCTINNFHFISHEKYDSDWEIRFKSLEKISSYIKINFALNKLMPLVFGRSI